MALQSSGEIKMSQINTELGRSSSATISLDDAENGTYATINTASSSYPNASNPAKMSEWYSYDHSAASGYEGLLSRDGASSSDEGCESLDPVNTVYKNGSSSTPAIGDQLFTDSALSNNVNPDGGFGRWYKYEDVEAGNTPYSLYLLKAQGGECQIENVVAC